MESIPRRHRKALIPDVHSTVKTLLSITLLPVAPMSNPKLNQPEKFLSSDAPNTTDSSPDLSLIPVPSCDVLVLIKNAIQSLTTFCSVQSPYAQDRDKRYPLWLVTLWDKIALVHIAYDRWKQSIAILRD